MKLMILDGNSVVNRAYYGIRPLTTRSGFNTNAIFGFLNILHRMENEESPDALCVAFDLKAPTFRHLMYDGYKATRHGMPDELAEQMPVLKEVLAALRIPIYQLEGWEADDILGTVGRLCEEAGWDCVVVTGDRDSLQLVDERVTVKLVTTKGGQTLTTRYDPGKFHEDYGFDPIHLIDLKALMGDSSDNIPGVKGVGEKTAMALIQLYGSIDHLYSHMPDICMAPETPAKPNVVKKLAEGEGQARMSYTLATIRTAADIIKLAMVKVAAALEREGLAARLVLQVHDELIVECPAQEAEQVLALLEQEMEQVVALSVPLLAEAKEGKSWYDAK